MLWYMPVIPATLLRMQKKKDFEFNANPVK
jgi:hypothetical protein